MNLDLSLPFRSAATMTTDGEDGDDDVIGADRGE